MRFQKGAQAGSVYFFFVLDDLYTVCFCGLFSTLAPIELPVEYQMSILGGGGSIDRY
jgi:hypothetical protein